MLLARVRGAAAVIRADAEVKILADEVVSGDLVVLNAGDFVPADCPILESKDLHLDEAALIGETYPVEKASGALAENTTLRLR